MQEGGLISLCPPRTLSRSPFSTPRLRHSPFLTLLPRRRHRTKSAGGGMRTVVKGARQRAPCISRGTCLPQHSCPRQACVCHCHTVAWSDVKGRLPFHVTRPAPTPWQAKAPMKIPSWIGGIPFTCHSELSEHRLSSPAQAMPRSGHGDQEEATVVANSRVPCPRRLLLPMTELRYTASPGGQRSTTDSHKKKQYI